MEQDYNKLLKPAVRAVLKPEGLFQKGSSRIWLDDNGWFFTVVEFQGSWCDRGSYLNVDPCFLWTGGTALTPDCYGVLPLGGREPGWVGWKGDEEAFVREITDMARTALVRVREFRDLADPKRAAAIPLKTPRRFVPMIAWGRFTLAALAGDIPQCRAFQKEMEEGCARWSPSVTAWFLEDMEQSAALLDQPQRLHARIVERIAAQRAYWRTRPGLRRLAVHPVYG